MSRLEETFKSIAERAGAKLVYGEPVSVGGKTILPIAKIRYGFGGGSGRKAEGDQEGGGGGGGLIANPVGIVEVTEAQTRFIPIQSHWALVAAVALGACFGYLAARGR